MKILIFGASGRSGRPLVEQGLAEGHTVTAFVRDPKKLPLSHPKLTIAQGDVTDAAAVTKAVTGQDAVLSTLGANDLKRHPELTEGVRHIVRAMEAQGVRRLVFETSFGVGDSRAEGGFVFRYLIAALLLKNPLADHEENERVIRNSKLDWVIVRPGRLVDGERTSVYQHGSFAGKSFASRISRADVADFMLKQLTDDTYLHRTPGLSY